MRRRTLFRWIFYAGAALLLALLQGTVLNRLVFWGTHPFLLPSLAAVAAAFETRREGFIFGAVLGLFSDLMVPGPIPCFYLLALSFTALLSSLISRRLVMPGLVCSLLCSAAGNLLTGLLYALCFLYSHPLPLSTLGLMMAKELLLTLPFYFLVHWLYRWVHLTFRRD